MWITGHIDLLHLLAASVFSFGSFWILAVCFILDVWTAKYKYAAPEFSIWLYFTLYLL